MNSILAFMRIRNNYSVMLIFLLFILAIGANKKAAQAIAEALKNQ